MTRKKVCIVISLGFIMMLTIHGGEQFMHELHLFRIKILQDRQLGLFKQRPKNEERHDYFFNVIKNADEKKGKNESLFWCATNPEKTSDTGILFQFGNHKPGVHSTWDKEGKLFVDVGDEEALYAEIFIETSMEICSVSPNSKLCKTPFEIAKRLGKFLNSQDKDLLQYCKFEISPILNIESFYDRAVNAFEISSYQVLLSRPNPPDEDEDIFKPLGEIVEKSGSNEMMVRMSGPDLNRERLKRMIRSAASVGAPQRARIRSSEGSQPIIIVSGEGDIAKIRCEAAISADSAPYIQEEVIKKYRSIRRQGQE